MVAYFRIKLTHRELDIESEFTIKLLAHIFYQARRILKIESDGKLLSFKMFFFPLQ
jgi:hypothetical protein